MSLPPSHISGYLHKKTRDGRWQKRWFETNANFLTYYKSKKMTKLLAALNLPQVGQIKAVKRVVDVNLLEDNNEQDNDQKIGDQESTIPSSSYRVQDQQK